jgi:hypothetical protein
MAAEAGVSPESPCGSSAQGGCTQVILIGAGDTRRCWQAPGALPGPPAQWFGPLHSGSRSARRSTLPTGDSGIASITCTVLGDLVAGQAGADRLPQLVLAGAGAGAQRDERGDRLDPGVIRDQLRPGSNTVG